MNFHYLVAELWHRPRRTLAAVVSMSLGVALVLTLVAYANAYQAAARAPLAVIGADFAVQRQGKVPEAFEGILFPHSTAPIHRNEIDEIRRIPGVEDVGNAVFFWDFAKHGFLVGLGLDPLSNAGPARLKASVTKGRFLQAGDHDVAVADATYAQTNGFDLGATVQIGGRSFRIVGLADTSRIGQVANANLYITVADARELASAAVNVRAVHDFLPDDANILFIKANQARVDEVSRAVGSVLGSQVLVSSAQSFTRVLDQSYGMINLFGLLVGLAGFLVALIGLARTLFSTLRERRRDIGLMKAVGWARGRVVAQLSGEAVGLAITGSVIGIVFGLIASSAVSLFQITIPVPWELSPTPHFAAGGAVPMSVTIALSAGIGLLPALLAVALSALCGLAIGLFVSRAAAKIKPAEVLRNE